MAAIFCKRPRLLCHNIVLLHANARHHTANWTYGCTSDRSWLSPKLVLSVLSLTEPWEAPGWQVIATDADVKQVITSWLQTPNSSAFILEYKPWYHCGANAEMVVVTTFRSDVYRLLHMCHVLIKVTVTFRHESVCYLISWKFLYIHCSLSRWVHKYWVFWMVGFLRHLLIICTVNYLFQ